MFFLQLTNYKDFDKIANEIKKYRKGSSQIKKATERSMLKNGLMLSCARFIARNKWKKAKNT
jgi:hypothetical protein